MKFTIDFWTFWGLIAQGFFFGRFVIQWFQSEKQGKIVVPHLFWIFSLIGSIMIFTYAIARKDIVFVIAGILQFFLFSRNLMISDRSSKHSNLNSKQLLTGNFEDKYRTKNPISQLLMKQFLTSFEKMLNSVGDKKKIRNICEIGCGDGELLKIIHQHFPKARLYATDIARSEITKARQNTVGIPIEFSVQNAESLNYKNNQFDLVICCEVLEHLNNPHQGLKEIKRVAKSAVVSVPNEPIWRILNLIRLKYIAVLGNTPGHINHWSINSFTKLLLANKFEIQSKNYPLPWQMYLISANVKDK